MKPIRTSLIGLGPWGQKLSSKLAAHPDFELVGIADRSFQNLNSFSTGLNVPGDRSLETMLERYLPDLVMISTPAHSHVELAMKCLNQGLNLWLTKPVTPTLRELENLHELAESKDLRIFFDHTFLFNPNFRKLESVLPQLSPAEKLEVLRGHKGGWQSGTSALEELIYHDLYMIQDLVAESPSEFSMKVDPTPDPKNQTETLTIRYKSGFSAKLSSSLGWETRRREVRWQGSDWNFDWVEESCKSNVELPEIPTTPDAIDLQFENLARAWHEDEPARATYTQAHEVMKWIELARKSRARGGEWVSYE